MTFKGLRATLLEGEKCPASVSLLNNYGQCSHTTGVPCFRDSSLLTNNPQIWQLKMKQNKKYFLSHSFQGSGIWGWLSWLILVQGLSWGDGQVVSWGRSYLKAVWRGYVLPNSLTCWKASFFTGCKWRFQYSFCGPLHRLLRVFKTWQLASPTASDSREKEGGQQTEATAF